MHSIELLILSQAWCDDKPNLHFGPYQIKQAIIGLDKQNLERKIVDIFFLSAQKNRLIYTALLSTNNICFGWEIRKLYFGKHSSLMSWSTSTRVC